MKIFSLCILLLLKPNLSSSFDFRTFDYCKISCEGQTHTACKCEQTKSKNTLISNDIANFRRQMVEIHNKFRNQIASGQEKGCPKAANMMLLTYDLELEYISRCLAKTMSEDNDRCRRKHDQAKNAGQNLFGSLFKVAKKDYNIAYEDAVTSWYKQIKRFPGNKTALLRSFQGGDHRDFTQMVWARNTHIGCSMVWIPRNPSKRNMIVCNYAGDNGGGNIRGESVYIFGEPCSQCPLQTRCDKTSTFPALCGSFRFSPRRGLLMSDSDDDITETTPMEDMTDDTTRLLPRNATEDITERSGSKTIPITGAVTVKVIRHKADNLSPRIIKGNLIFIFLFLLVSLVLSFQ